MCFFIRILEEFFFNQPFPRDLIIFRYLSSGYLPSPGL